MGLVTPLGHTVKATWENLLKGQSGIAPLSLFDVSTFPVRIAADVAELAIRNIVALPAANDLLFHSQDGIPEVFHILILLFQQVQYEPEGRFTSDPWECGELLHSFFQ